MFQRKCSKNIVTKNKVSKNSWSFTLYFTLSVQSHSCSSFLNNQISLDKSKEEMKPLLELSITPLMMGTPDTNGWGKTKVNSHQAPLLNKTQGQILVLICANRLQKLWCSWISSVRVRPEFGSPTVVEYFILAASLTSGSWDCNQLRVIQSIWGSHLEGKFL